MSQTSIRRNRLTPRIAFVAGTFAFVLILLFIRLVGLVTFGQPTIHSSNFQEAPQALFRGDIVDRNGVLLATSLPTDAVAAIAGKFIDKEKSLSKLSDILPNLDKESILLKLEQNRNFIWIDRGITPAQAQKINDIGDPGFILLREEGRFYPNLEVTAHILGMVNVDNEGLAGIEKSSNEQLKKNDESVRLSIDIDIQSILHTVATDAVKFFSALGAGGVILDSYTGEILALTSIPSFSPYERYNFDFKDVFNRVTLGVYEFGDLMVPITIAMAIDSNLISLESVFDTETPIDLGYNRITDQQFAGKMTALDILQYSAKLGAARIADKLGSKLQKKYLGQLGLLTPAPFEIGEIGRPLVPSKWDRPHVLTIGFGQGIATTLLQYASAYGALINGGVYRPPTLLLAGETVLSPNSVFRKDTSLTMIKALRQTVLTGTGKLASTPYLSVIGKTGTMPKSSSTGYSPERVISSFVGAFPEQSPRYIVAFFLDEPIGTDATFGFNTAGWTAAPTVRTLIIQVAPFLGILSRSSETSASRAIPENAQK